MGKILTLEIAQKFLNDPDGVSLRFYTSIDDAAAQALGEHKGDYLWLGGLTSLSDAAAQALAQHKGGLNLNGLTSLSEAAAQALAQRKGDLCLYGKAEEAEKLVRKRLAKQK